MVISFVEVEATQPPVRINKMADQKDFSKIIFAMAALLICCSPVSSFSLPRVSRTSDAIIIDFADDDSAAVLYKNENDYGAIANPGFSSMPTFNPYAMMYQQRQQPMFYNGWFYSFGHPSPMSPPSDRDPNNRQFEAEDEEYFDNEQTVRQSGPFHIAPAVTTTTPRPAITTTTKPAAATPTTTPAATTTPVPSKVQCGRGPTTFPKSLQLIGERVLAPVVSSAVTTAKKNSWPFMVTLKNKDGDFFCAGTLISDIKVLLAAQCLEKLSLFDMSGVTVSIGANTVQPLDAQMTRRISKVVVHSKYNAANYANDIAIITMDTPVVLSRTVAPVCLAPASGDPDQYTERDAIILGWGTANIKSPNADLLQAKVAIVANSECRADTDFGKYVSESTICIASTEVFTCAGDIGGPVVIMSSPGTWSLVGINSYTKGDCSATGLKTRVSAFRAWIDLYNM